MRFFGALLLFVFACGSAASAAPALWVVEAPTSGAKAYLFGTVHVLRPSVAWHSPTLDAALKESAELWLEVPNADDPAAAAPTIAALGLDPAHPLSTLVAAADVARLDDAAKAIGAPGEAAFERFRPWFASLTLSVVPLVKAGYDPRSGVEAQLKPSFVADKKPIRGFETLDEQLHFFADMPTDKQIAYLHDTLDAIPTVTATLDRLVDAWASGDVDRLVALLNGTTFRSDQAFYNTLIVERNARWAKTLQTRLAQPGIAFVAVGAAHLSGDASVQADLMKLGYRVRRLQ